MSNQFQNRMDDGGYAILTDVQISDLKKQPSISDRIKAKLNRSPEIESLSFSYNNKTYLLERKKPKTIGATPAPPKERIKGSKANPAGTASTRSSVGGIEISEETEQALKNKIKEYKERYPSRKAPTLGALKKVFRRGAGAFSSSFRPTIRGGKPNSRNAWAIARVNKFLIMASGGKVKKSYREADGDLL